MVQCEEKKQLLGHQANFDHASESVSKSNLHERDASAAVITLSGNWTSFDLQNWGLTLFELHRQLSMQRHHTRRRWECHWAQMVTKEGNSTVINVHGESNHFSKHTSTFCIVWVVWPPKVKRRTWGLRRWTSTPGIWYPGRSRLTTWPARSSTF